MKISVNQFSANKPERALIKKTSAVVLKELGKDNLNSELVINVVLAPVMKRVNYRFRGLNQTTDVLSFAYHNDKQLPLKIWGEIFIDRKQVLKNSHSQKIDYHNELKLIIIHGILHLCGYDHERVSKKIKNKMLTKQKQIYRQIEKTDD